MCFFSVWPVICVKRQNLIQQISKTPYSVSYNVQKIKYMAEMWEGVLEISASWSSYPTTYQVLQLFWTTAPGEYVLSPCTQGHIAMGTHWPWSSCTSPDGHWQPGTHILKPVPPPTPPSSQFQPWRRSEHAPLHAWPHSWYTWPPEHLTAGETQEGEMCEKPK